MTDATAGGPTRAAEMPPEDRTPPGLVAPPHEEKRGFHITPSMSQGLLAAGLGLMSSRSPCERLHVARGSCSRVMPRLARGRLARAILHRGGALTQTGRRRHNTCAPSAACCLLTACENWLAGCEHGARRRGAAADGAVRDGGLRRCAARG